METKEALLTALKCLVAICVLLLAFWLAVMWLCLLPFRLALHRNRQPRTGEELAVLVSLAVSGLALLRSGQPAMTRREWKRRYRRLMAQRPDDRIPF